MERDLLKGIDCIGVSVHFFCHDGTGRFVMAKRSNHTRDEHGCWDIGGGGIEFGQTVEDTLHNEIKEEYCTDIIASEFLGYRTIFREQNGRKTHWVGLDFKVLVKPEMVNNGEPHKFEEVAWFTFDTLPANIHSQNPHFFELYKHKLINQ
jgi:8-oxo-dGTP diphosphatase